MNKKFLTLFVVTLFVFVLCALGFSKFDLSSIIPAFNKEDTILEDKDDSEDVNKDDSKDKSEDADKDKTENDIDVDKVTDEDDDENVSTLSKDNVLASDEFRIFYFDNTEVKMHYYDTKLTVIDKATINALTKELQSSSNIENKLSLTNESNVTFAKINNDIIEVHFDKDFTNLMTLGSNSESGLIESIVNTYGYNLDMDKVAIYFGDTLYTGVSGNLPDGYFKVDCDNISKGVK